MRKFVLVAALAVAAALILVSPANASSITWRYDMLVHGTALTASTPVDVIAIPVGTPLTVYVSFETSSTNFCPNAPTTRGQYNVSGFVDFLGFRYVAAGGIEINSASGTCQLDVDGVRLFVGSGLQLDPGGTQIRWPLFPNGTMYLPIPPSAFLARPTRAAFLKNFRLLAEALTF
jgi:hypothetical protein